MGFWNWAKGSANKPAQPVEFKTVAQPIVINPGDKEKIAHARYRLDAIKRHVEQNAPVLPSRKEEFRREARMHVASLYGAGEMSAEEHDGIFEHLGIKQ